MDEQMYKYLRQLKPAPHPDGRELVEEGKAMGSRLQAGRSRFIKESGGKYGCHADYHNECRREGKILWMILMGLATLDEQVESIKKIYEYSQRTGLGVDIVQCIPSGVVALPKELWDKVPATTSYTMSGLADYQRQFDAAPLELTFGDHHVVTPNCLETTQHAIVAGSPRIGEFSQFTWGHPGFDDDLGRYSDMVRSIGMIASKREEKISVETYLDDGFPAYFIDCMSYIAYALLEHYIVEDLCGARYSISYGGLLSDIDTRMGLALAMHELFNTEEFTSLSYINSSTNMQWDHDIDANYGFSSQEFLFEILCEKKYHMGLGINPVSITEKVRVPTLQELLNIFSCGKRVEEKAEEWLPFMNFEPLEHMRDVMVREGRKMFENAMAAFREAGIDTEDPLEMILVLKKFNPVKFEQMFHTNVQNGVVIPFYPTVLGRQTADMTQDVIEQLEAAGMKGKLDGVKVLVASGDAHTYGLLLVESVLTAMGATVVNGGVDMDPVDLLDMAEEEGIRYVGVSVHNGQALGYGKQLVELQRGRDRDHWFFMGGKMNAILPGHTEPIDVDDKLREMGIHAQNELLETVNGIYRDACGMS